ncbi:SDR family NAD(P)-dependent oxidoreductase [Fischerella thermalis]|uniref:Short-chain dehydrogenase n=1 Tax=Fischerella thermalis CCMEE 5318 TaxID=2019666 RepID=A0A2N6LGS3_9CYAN|nr:SDR family oxidoreductase [Fischerella thermalis]PMB23136.1 short-chain dehydrogenase [Fischerella thermalis CCMEE 5318]
MTSKLSFQGKTAIVTGGGRGLGRAVCLALVKTGVSVGVIARTSAEILDVTHEIQKLGGQAFPIQCDMAEADAIEKACLLVAEQLGSVDILVNNAAIIAPLGRTVEIDPVAWERTIKINLNGAFRCIHAVLPNMIKQGWGRIVNISSVAATGTGTPSGNAYATSKAALEMMTLNLAAELEGTGVKVNAFRPGTIDTAMQAEARSAPVEVVGEAMHNLFQGFYNKGMLRDPKIPAAVVIDIIRSDLNGQILDINEYLNRGISLEFFSNNSNQLIRSVV